LKIHVIFFVFPLLVFKKKNDELPVVAGDKGFVMSVLIKTKAHNGKNEFKKNYSGNFEYF